MQLCCSGQKIQPCYSSNVVQVFLGMVTAEQHRAGQALCRESLNNLELSTLAGRKAENTIE